MVPLVGALALVLSSCIWPAFRYGPERTGFNAAETTLSTTNVGDLKLKWYAETGPGNISSPTVAGGVLYTTANGDLQAYSAAGTTGCTGDPSTCEPLWTANVSGFAASPAVSGGVVYVTTNLTVFGDPFDVVDGQILAFDAAGTNGCSGTPKTCNPLWRAESDNVAAAASPAVANGLLYVGADGLQIFDAAGTNGCSGTPKVCTALWSGSPGVPQSSPAIANGIGYQVSAGTLEAFDANGCSSAPLPCSQKWSGNPSTSPTTPAVTSDFLYIGSDDGKLRAFKTAASFPQCIGTPKICNPAWTRTTGGAVRSSPAVANGVVYVGSDDAKLYALDATTGAVLWTAPTGGAVQSSPTVANGVVYVGSDDTKLYAFDATGTTNCSGTPKVCSSLWSFATDDAVQASPAVVNGKVYVNSIAGTLFAFGL
jgi:outer membrane protein assembly factor BamB